MQWGLCLEIGHRCRQGNFTTPSRSRARGAEVVEQDCQIVQPNRFIAVEISVGPRRAIGATKVAEQEREIGDVDLGVAVQVGQVVADTQRGGVAFGRAFETVQW